MHTWDDECLRFAVGELSDSDSLLIDPSRPLGEEEAACIESLCEAVGPGPLVFDDVANGEGAVVATLPDGRHIVSLTPAGSLDDPSWIQSHARLICQARPYLLRLLRDRRRWQHEREELLARIASLDPSQLRRPAEAFRPTRPR